MRGNQWMFRMGHPLDPAPLRLRPELLPTRSRAALYPILRERTPVRMDSPTGAGATFFLGVRTILRARRSSNVSIDLGVRGRDAAPRPPVEVYLRVIDEPVLRLTSVDLGATADISTLAEVFDFAQGPTSRPAQGRRHRRRAWFRSRSSNCNWKTPTSTGCNFCAVSIFNKSTRGRFTSATHEIILLARNASKGFSRGNRRSNMATKFDAIIIGGGHNGLVTACLSPRQMESAGAGTPLFGGRGLRHRELSRSNT